MKVIYTCITGNYDNLKVPLIHNSNWEHICFTDNPVLLEKRNVGLYKILPIDVKGIDSVRLARMYKILGLGINDADISIWHDANFQICCDLDDLVKKYLKEDIELVLAKHPQRSCLYSESEKCIKLGKDNLFTINTQVEHYKNDGMSENYKLYETGILIRRKFNDNLFYRKWWEEVYNYSRRDQISFPYCLWKYLQFAPNIYAVPAKELRDNFIKLKHNKNTFGGKY